MSRSPAAGVMHKRPGGLRALMLAVSGACWLGAADAQTDGVQAGAAAGFVPPRTSWGAPDLQGVWSNAAITDLQRNPRFPNLVLTEAEAAEIEGADYYNNRTREDAKPNDPNDKRLLDGTDLLSGGGYNAFWVDQGTKVARVKGELRSSWIVEPANGRIPYLQGKGPQPQAQPVSAPRKAPPGAPKPGGITVQGPGAVNPNEGGGYGSYDGPETRPLGERCVIGFGNTGGPVMNNVLYNNHYQIVQSPDAVVILVEMVHDARIIPIVSGPDAVQRGPEEIKPWLGESVGWYEGSALVVETRNVNPKQRGYISASGVLRERFELWSKDHLVYGFEVTDPTLYSQSWHGEAAWSLSAEPLFEYACHEGNYAMPGILAGARKLEADGRLVARETREEGR